ncbi:MAG: PHP domain-containing protein, partial [Spirochaetales bacterium]|nr:PHP domain-containing protein [Spirochaetales bacterium]
MQLKIDLHNHSCLSPCGSDQLLPPVLAYEAFEKGVDILALTDHNSGRNLVAFSEACEIVGITGVYGIEVTTQEEVHLLALFETPEEGVDFSNWIESLLPKWPNVPQKLGHQLVC